MIMNPEDKRKLALVYAFSFVGTFYKWGGDDPSGFDCSGYIIEILKSVGILPRRFDTTANGLYRKFQNNKLDKPKPGALIFWPKTSKPNEAGHIELAIDAWHTLGASGGGSKTLTEADAIRDNAYIKMRPIKRNRNVLAILEPFI